MTLKAEGTSFIKLATGAPRRRTRTGKSVTIHWFRV